MIIVFTDLDPEKRLENKVKAFGVRSNNQASNFLKKLEMYFEAWLRLERLHLFERFMKCQQDIFIFVLAECGM